MKIGWLLPAVAATALCLVPSAAPQVGNGKIAFVRNGDIWTVDPDTRIQANLTADHPSRFHGGPLSWSPDGKRLLYMGGLQVNPNEFQAAAFVMNGDGTAEHPLIADLTRFWSPVCWLSSDLVVLKMTAKDLQSADFYLIRADGTELRPLTSDGKQTASFGAVCSPTAGRLFFTNGDSHYSVAEDGTLTRLPLVAGSISPSPDGHRLAWVANGLFVAKIDGTALLKVADPPVNGPAVWSPDGNELAFGALRIVGEFRGEPTYASSVHVVSASGGDQRALTSRPNTYDAPIAWAPDSTKLLFSSTRGGAFVMNSDGTCETKLLENYDSGAGLAWQSVQGNVSAPIVCVDLGVLGMGEAQNVALGGIATYTFTVTNDGNEVASGIVAETQLFGEADLVSIGSTQGSCDLGTGSCRLGALEPGRSAQVTIRLRSAFTGPGSYSFVGANLRVSAPEIDSDETNNSAGASARAYPCVTVGTSGPDYLRGTVTDDSICGLTGADRIFGRGGRDTVYGGPGADFLNGGAGRDVLSGGGEYDTILASDGERDEIDCGGAGDDMAVVDRVDEVDKCGIVVYPRIHCGSIGTRSPNRLVGTVRRNKLCGLGGGDTIHGLAGNDELDGGQGNDTIDGGPGRDLMFGGAGYDVLLARDGERDAIDCGPNFDIAIADRHDRVARNCEDVRRPRNRGSRTG